MFSGCFCVFNGIFVGFCFFICRFDTASFLKIFKNLYLVQISEQKNWTKMGF